jgi:hypothetical protein
MSSHYRKVVHGLVRMPMSNTMSDATFSSKISTLTSYPLLSVLLHPTSIC